MAKPILTATRLREILHYDPETGFLTSKRGVGRIALGARTGGVEKDGYRTSQIDGIKHREHRLAWLYMTGFWPDHTIDHLNGERADNRFSNLREASRLVNKQNARRAYSSNKAGFLGVSPHQGLWQASIQVDRKQIYLGRYKTPEEAHQVYLSAKRKLHEGNTL